MKKIIYVLIFLLPHLVSAAGLPEPRWEASGQAVHGPVRQVITRETRYGHFKDSFPRYYRWVYEYNIDQELTKKQFFSILDENNENLIQENIFKNNIEIERKGYTGMELEVDEEQFTVTRDDRGERTIFYYSDGFDQLLKVEAFQTDGDTIQAKFIDYYRYNQEDKLTKIMREQYGKLFPYKTVYYDGGDHQFETPYFLEADSSGELGIMLHDPDNILGHKIIEVFDPEGRRVRLLRRRILTGDRENPETIEEAEKMVETIESLFDDYGCEKIQNNYLEGELYIYFRSEYSNYDDYNNWRERKVFGLGKDDSEYLYSESTREITYY